MSPNSMLQQGCLGRLTFPNSSLIRSATLLKSRPKRLTVVSIGNTGELAAEEAILASGYTILGRQVFVRDQFGQLRVIDFIIGNQEIPNSIAAVEVKANTGRRNERQRTIDLNLEISGGTIVSHFLPWDKLEYGMKIRLHTTVLEVDVARP